MVIVSRWYWVALVFVLAGLFSLYAPALTGPLFYDDYANLDGLEQIHEIADFPDYVLSGHAGPLGRPIALLSFAFQADSWPENTEKFILINVLIHLSNSVLLFILGISLLRLRETLQDRTIFLISLSATCLWAVLPLLASTSLIVVQRMTGLGAFWGLAGLLVFTTGYRLRKNSEIAAFIIQFGGLGLGTLLAILTKENGALIPLFALIIDRLIGKDHGFQKKPLSLVSQCGLWGALLFILYYISPMNLNWFAVSETRGWSSFERLQTQLVLMWHYLEAAFLPLPTQFSPFHDDVRLVVEPWKVLVSAVGWIGCVVAGIMLRSRNVWILFAVLWFLVGHILESTTLHLELYFEHRNYLAVYGFCLLISYLSWTVSGKLSKVMPIFLVLYIVIQSASLFALTTLWGQPHKAAEVWSERAPDSSRAALHLAIYDHQNIGGTVADDQRALIDFGRRAFANRALDRVAEKCTTCLDIRIQALAYACDVESPDKISARYEDLLSRAATGNVNIAVVDGLFLMRELTSAEKCQPLGGSQGYKLAERLLDNPRVGWSDHDVRIRFMAASFAYDQGNLDQAMVHLNAAETKAPYVIPVLQFQVHVLVQEGRFEAAKNAIERRQQDENTVQQLNSVSPGILSQLEQFILQEKQQP